VLLLVAHSQVMAEVAAVQYMNFIELWKELFWTLFIALSVELH